MDLMGQTQTATYAVGPRANYSASFLPHLEGGGGATSVTQQMHAYLPPPGLGAPLRRSLTTLGFQPSSSAASYFHSATMKPSTAIAQSMGGSLSARAGGAGAEYGAALSATSELEGLRVPSVFSGARNALYTRYTPNDWMASNLNQYGVSDRIRSMAERLRYDTLRTCRETDDRTKRAQEESGKQLGDRVTDISFWKQEAAAEIDAMMTEINQLTEAKRAAEKVLAETENPLHISQECLYNREKRQAIDLVHDHVEKNLLLEIDIIKKCQDKMRHALTNVDNQLAVDRAAQHELEKDTSDKFVAQQLDESCHSMRNSSQGIHYHDGIEKVDTTVSVPETWAKFTNDNIQRSRAERNASKDLRRQIEAVMDECAADMWKQWSAVGAALSQRIQESTDTRNKLQTHLSKVLQEIFDIEKTIEFLKKAIVDKEAPMRVAQTRLATRVQRPNVELCRDPPQYRLVREVQEIRESIHMLEDKLRQAEAALQTLLQAKGNLEQDLNVKNNSIFIDRERCLGIRKTFPMSPKLAVVPTA